MVTGQAPITLSGGSRITNALGGKNIDHVCVVIMYIVRYSYIFVRILGDKLVYNHTGSGIIFVVFIECIVRIGM